MKTVQNFTHLPGFHCGSTSVRLMLDFFGHKVSEPMVLGVSRALQNFYLEGDSFSPTRLFFPRNGELEVTGFLGFRFKVNVLQTDDPELAWDWVRVKIDAGEPAMIQADVKELPYYKTGTRFAGHKIIIFGYDLDKKEVLVSDNEFPDVQTISLDQLAKARVSPQAPFDLRNNFFELTSPEKVPDRPEMIVAALKGQAEILLKAPEPFGIAALENMARRIGNWGRARDWPWCARFTYQVIEKRGTGGGAFRLKYADFLEEASQDVPKIRELGLASIIRESAGLWTKLAGGFKTLSLQEKPESFDALSPIILTIVDAERRFADTVVEKLPG